MSYSYHLRTDTIVDEEGKVHTAFGISAIGHDGKPVASVPDIFFHRKVAEEFVTACNKYKVSLAHLMDVIHDAVTEQHTLQFVYTKRAR